MVKLVPGILRNLEEQKSGAESDEDYGEESVDEEAQAALKQEIKSRRIVKVKGVKK